MADATTTTETAATDAALQPAPDPSATAPVQAPSDPALSADLMLQKEDKWRSLRAWDKWAGARFDFPMAENTAWSRSNPLPFHIPVNYATHWLDHDKVQAMVLKQCGGAHVGALTAAGRAQMVDDMMAVAQLAKDLRDKLLLDPADSLLRDEEIIEIKFRSLKGRWDSLLARLGNNLGPEATLNVGLLSDWELTPRVLFSEVQWAGIRSKYREGYAVETAGQTPRRRELGVPPPAQRRRTDTGDANMGGHQMDRSNAAPPARVTFAPQNDGGPDGRGDGGNDGAADPANGQNLNFGASSGRGQNRGGHTGGHRVGDGNDPARGQHLAGSGGHGYDLRGDGYPGDGNRGGNSHGDGRHGDGHRDDYNGRYPMYYDDGHHGHSGWNDNRRYGARGGYGGGGISYRRMRGGYGGPRGRGGFGRGGHGQLRPLPFNISTEHPTPQGIPRDVYGPFGYHLGGAGLRNTNAGGGNGRRSNRDADDEIAPDPNATVEDPEVNKNS